MRGMRGEKVIRAGSRRSAAPAKKTAPTEQTNAENFYYQKQMQSKTPMVVVLRDGEEVHGYIEWYDKNCIKLNRSGAANLMIPKPAIKYMFKEGENGGSSRHSFPLCSSVYPVVQAFLLVTSPRSD